MGYAEIEEERWISGKRKKTFWGKVKAFLVSFQRIFMGLEFHTEIVANSQTSMIVRTYVHTVHMYIWLVIGSVAEFLNIVPLLTSASPDRDFVFEVIAPSIPGYGFSSAPAKVRAKLDSRSTVTEIENFICNDHSSSVCKLGYSSVLLTFLLFLLRYSIIAFVRFLPTISPRLNAVLVQ